MATLEELHTALQKADAAGDVEAAKAIAKMYAQQQAQSAPPAPPQPSMMDRAQANPVIGAPLQTVVRAGQGVEQLLARGAASVSDLGGMAPNPVSRTLRGLSADVDQSVNDQNARYAGAKSRVVGASTNPRVMEALIDTGEVGGNMLNPSGLSGNLVKSAPGLVNAIEKGIVSGVGFGASQPVIGDTSNYWQDKAKQVGGSAAVAGVTGGVTAALGGEKFNPNTPPTKQQLKTQASEAYKQAEEGGVVIRQDSFKNTVADIKAAVEKQGLDADLHPKTTAVLKRFEADANAGDITLEKAETLRRVANSALDSQDKSDRNLAHTVIDKLDDFVGKMKPSDVASNGDATEAVGALNKARDLWARSAKAETLERLSERAKNAVGANYTQAGYETAIRQQYRSLANNDRAMSRFSPEEKAAIRQVVRGGPVENVLRLVGKVAIRGPVSAMPAGFALGAGSPGIAAAIAGGGEVAKFGATQLSLRNARLAEELMRSGGNPLSPLPGPTPNAPVGNDLATALIVQALMKPRAQ